MVHAFLFCLWETDITRAGLLEARGGHDLDVFLKLL